MAGLAPLGGLPTSKAPDGTAATVPGSITPPYASPQQQPQPAPTGQNQNFTAFPSSYAGFGADGNGFGTLSVVNGALTILSTPAGGLPPPHTNPNGTPSVGAPATPPSPNGATAPAPTTTAGAVAGTDQVPNPYTAVPPAPPPPPPPNQAKTAATTGQNGDVPGSTTTLDATAQTAPGSPNTPPGTPSAQGGTAQATGNDPPSNDPPPGNNNNANTDPTAGLLGAQPPNAIPGSNSPPVNPAQGLLGSPPTNPIVIQAEAQEEQAAQAAQQAADQAAQQRAAEQIEVQQLTQRISAAYADNNSAAVAQLQPLVTKLEGQIQGQTWAGLGATPPQPFKLPEVPTVFLNVPT